MTSVSPRNTFAVTPHGVKLLQRWLILLHSAVHTWSWSCRHCGWSRASFPRQDRSSQFLSPAAHCHWLHSPLSTTSFWDTTAWRMSASSHSLPSSSLGTLWQQHRDWVSEWVRLYANNIETEWVSFESHMTHQSSHWDESYRATNNENNMLNNNNKICMQTPKHNTNQQKICTQSNHRHKL